MAGNTKGKNITAFASDAISFPPNALSSFLIPKDTTVNMPAMSIAVRACVKPIGVIFFNIHEDKVIPNAIAGSTITRPIVDLII